MVTLCPFSLKSLSSVVTHAQETALSRSFSEALGVWNYWIIVPLIQRLQHTMVCVYGYTTCTCNRNFMDFAWLFWSHLTLHVAVLSMPQLSLPEIWGNPHLVECQLRPSVREALCPSLWSVFVKLRCWCWARSICGRQRYLWKAHHGSWSYGDHGAPWAWNRGESCCGGMVHLLAPFIWDCIMEERPMCLGEIAQGKMVLLEIFDHGHTSPSLPTC